VPRIKGWRKVAKKGYKHFWRNRHDETTEVGIQQLLISKRWLVTFFERGFWSGERDFETEAEALKYAKELMKAHPYG